VKNRIFYFCPDFNEPAGGIKVIYQHVDILNENGYQAAILHSKKGFRCNWFENNTKVLAYDAVKLSENDVVVLPEIYFHLSSNPTLTFKDKIRKIRGKKLDYYVAKLLWQSPCIKIIFNQNAYHTFLDFSNRYPLKSTLFDIPKAYFSISNQNKSYLDFVLKNKNIYRVQWSLNFDIFKFEPQKKRQICYMTRKNPQHVTQVINILKSRNNLNGFELVPIENKNEQGVANIMKESAIYLSFGYPEGLPLPPAEAMACGCIVVGYDGGGGQEYFLENHCIPIPFGNIIEFCKKTELLCNQYDVDNDKYTQMSRDAARYIQLNYNKEKEKENLLKVWEDLKLF
jgi:hypothetical protein